MDECVVHVLDDGVWHHVGKSWERQFTLAWRWDRWTSWDTNDWGHGHKAVCTLSTIACTILACDIFTVINLVPLSSYGIH